MLPGAFRTRPGCLYLVFVIVSCEGDVYLDVLFEKKLIIFSWLHIAKETQVHNQSGVNTGGNSSVRERIAVDLTL